MTNTAARMIAPLAAHVSVHALDAGFLTLPEKVFVTPLEDDTARKTVPSMSFLIQHSNPQTQQTTRLVFDLGIRKSLDEYPKPVQEHIKTRKPISGESDTITSLAKGGLRPEDIDYVVFSHLHWDHIGTPSHYPTSKYVVGPGARRLVDGTSSQNGLGSHNHFEQGILDLERTVELGNVQATLNLKCNGKKGSDGQKRINGANGDSDSTHSPDSSSISLFRPWRPLGLFPQTIDIFGDGSLFIVAAPGHLDGHINLLCRLEDGRYVYLAGDSCHDGRLLTGEKKVATWIDEASDTSRICCIHKDKQAAEKTLDIIRRTMKGEAPELGEVEIVFAHDVAWEKEAKQSGRFFPGEL